MALISIFERCACAVREYRQRLCDAELLAVL